MIGHRKFFDRINKGDPQVIPRRGRRRMHSFPVADIFDAQDINRVKSKINNYPQNEDAAPRENEDLPAD